MTEPYIMTPGAEGLTQRQLEIFETLVQTGSAERAAKRLGIGRVELNHSTLRLRRRLGVRSNLQALRRLMRLGLVE